MRPILDRTHDAAAKSWVETANLPGDFPIQNLPFGVFRPRGSTAAPRVGVAIGSFVLDLAGCAKDGLLNATPVPAKACEAPTLNALMALGEPHWWVLRNRLHDLLRSDAEAAIRRRVEAHLLPLAQAELLAPAVIGDYTDFYASIHHATNVGSLFRPDNPLLPNYKYVPIGYHGRASSIVVSGTPVRRPCGQRKPGEQPPQFGESRQLDYELELGFFVGPGNTQGTPVPIASAEAHIFGVCLVNDWSARDIQAWEYQPLGPFLAKSFATSLSPWVVTLDALAPFRTGAYRRAAGDPPPLPYLSHADDEQYGGFDITLEVFLRSQKMREQNLPAARLSQGSFREMYWTLAQMLTHHASNGCNLRPGDLLASGTVSGAAAESRGCLLELTRRGAEPLPLPSGETRSFLEDGDEVVLRGYCEREGFVRIGLGECSGQVISGG
ncbi:MAG: fumarylacetoacetase [Acidobacteria bacterium]|nr:fumarylacetoacetase [Acidobacteriota bacterium]